jgi:hypothetical protein
MFNSSRSNPLNKIDKEEKPYFRFPDFECKKPFARVVRDSAA